VFSGGYRVFMEYLEVVIECLEVVRLAVVWEGCLVEVI